MLEDIIETVVCFRRRYSWLIPGAEIQFLHAVLFLQTNDALNKRSSSAAYHLDRISLYRMEMLVCCRGHFSLTNGSFISAVIALLPHPILLTFGERISWLLRAFLALWALQVCDKLEILVHCDKCVARNFGKAKCEMSSVRMFLKCIQSLHEKWAPTAGSVFHRRGIAAHSPLLSAEISLKRLLSQCKFFFFQQQNCQHQSWII